MAHLLIAQDHIPPDRLAIRLREELPDDLIVVVGAQVMSVRLALAVLTAQGILIIHPCDAPQAMTATARRRANTALAQFLADEFPSLHPTIRHLAVLADDASPGEEDGGWAAIVSPSDLVLALDTIEWPPTAQPLDTPTRRVLGTALCERGLTTNQRATAPFMFQTGGILRQGHQAWTLRAVIDHLDRYPDDGITHLHNGTLLHWFEAQGANHMVRLLRAATQTGERDGRAQLEAFLLATGLVDPPTVVVKPAQLRLGPVAANTTTTTRLTVRRGRGRGYLMGSVRADQPWVRVEPNHLTAGQLDATVFVDTDALAVQRTPHMAHLRLITNAQTPEITLPIQVRVAGGHTLFWRTRLLPWVGVLLIALVGAGAGWWLGTWAALGKTWPIAPLWIALVVGLASGGSMLALRRMAHWRRMAPSTPTGRSGRSPHPVASVPKASVGAWVEGIMGLAIIAAVLLYALRPAPVTDEVVALESLAAGYMSQLEVGIDRLVDGWMLRTYDRRAPWVSPLATPEL